MRPDLSRTSTCEVTGSHRGQKEDLPPCSPVKSLSNRRLGIGAGIALGLIGIGLAAVIARSEFYPPDLAQAEAAYRRNDLQACLRLAESHLARRPSHRQASVLAARCLSRLGQPDRAEALYQQAGDLSLEDQHVRAFGLLVNNRREAAIQAYRAIAEKRPADVLALSRLGAVLISESRWDDALETSERLIKIPEGAVIGHTLAGVVNHNRRDSELAVFAFSRALELDPLSRRCRSSPGRCSGRSSPIT